MPEIEPTTEANAETPTAPAQEPDWKAEARKWEERSKANLTRAETAETTIATLTGERDSAVTRATEAETRATAAEATIAESAAKTERATWLAEITESTGVPGDLLRGTTRDELAAHAEVLKPHFAAPAPQEPAKGPVVSEENGNPDTQAPIGERAFVRDFFGSRAD